MNDISVRDYIKSNYEDYYTGTDNEWRSICSVGKANNIISLCKNMPNKSIIEIGAGEGSTLKRLSELGFGERLYALEISSSAVEAINNREISHLVECNLFDGYHASYGNNRFDIAILSHVIEHVEHPRQLIYEASRIARYLFVEVPLEDTLRMSDDFVFDRTGHVNFYSNKTIRRLLQSCELNILNEKIINPSKHVYTYQKGKKGLLNYYIKQYMLQFFPVVATSIFTYHAALLCE